MKNFLLLMPLLGVLLFNNCSSDYDDTPTPEPEIDVYGVYDAHDLYLGETSDINSDNLSINTSTGDYITLNIQTGRTISRGNHEILLSSSDVELKDVVYTKQFYPGYIFEILAPSAGYPNMTWFCQDTFKMTNHARSHSLWQAPDFTSPFVFKNKVESTNGFRLKECTGAETGLPDDPSSIKAPLYTKKIIKNNH